MAREGQDEGRFDEADRGHEVVPVGIGARHQALPGRGIGLLEHTDATVLLPAAGTADDLQRPAVARPGEVEREGTGAVRSQPDRFQTGLVLREPIGALVATGRRGTAGGGNSSRSGRATAATSLPSRTGSR